jgi:hypothetical protein
MGKFTIREIEKAPFYKERMPLMGSMRRSEQNSKNCEKLLLGQARLPIPPRGHSEVRRE